MRKLLLILLIGAICCCAGKANGTKTQNTEDALIAEINTETAIIREGPSTDTLPVMKIVKGTRLVVKDRQGLWYEVITPTRSSGWVLGDSLTFTGGLLPSDREPRNATTELLYTTDKR